MILPYYYYYNFAYSNHQVVLTAEDGSLWVMGIEEHTRKNQQEPLRVESDFTHPSGSFVEENGIKYAVVCTDKTRTKGGDRVISAYDRVTVLYENSVIDDSLQSNTDEDTNAGSVTADDANDNDDDQRRLDRTNGLFHIVLYGGEAYYKAIDIPLEKTADEENNSNNKVRKIAFYASGWQHNVIGIK